MISQLYRYVSLPQLLEWTGSIDNIYNPKIFGLENVSLIELIYSTKKEVDPSEIVIAKSLDHTMFESLDIYVKQKLPLDSFKKAIIENKQIEIHGIYPTHLQEVQILPFQNKLRRIKFKHNPNSKDFNFVRPEFYEDADRLCIFVTPGKDYIQHYSSLIFYLLDTLTTRWMKYTSVYRYPYAENSVHAWSQLNDSFINDGDVLIIGYIQEFREYLQKLDKNLQFTEFENEYYKSYRYKLGKKWVCMLGVKFSFWGNLSSKVVNRCLQLGVSEVIYYGKLGTLVNPDTIYNRLFSPTKYSMVYHDKLVCFIEDLNNPLAERFPKLDSQMHTSVPTILEEDYTQREILTLLDSQTIDNEISQIAYTIKRFNEDRNKDISYSCIHFATDYIRQLDKPDLITEHDLSNNRTKSALNKKNKIISKANEILHKYLITK